MTLQIRFIPLWAARVVKAAGGAYSDSLAHLPPNDLKYLRLANHLFVRHLIGLGISRNEFTGIADDWNEPYTEADALFAINGATGKHSIADWTPTHLSFVTEPGVGYTVVEDDASSHSDLVLNHLRQMDIAEGGKPYQSSAFNILLTRVANHCMQ